MRKIADWDMNRLSELSAMTKCGCGKTKDPNGHCDGSHSTLTEEEIKKLNEKYKKNNKKNTKSLVKTKKYVII